MHKDNDLVLEEKAIAEYKEGGWNKLAGLVSFNCVIEYIKDCIATREQVDNAISKKQLRRFNRAKNTLRKNVTSRPQVSKSTNILSAWLPQR